MLNSRMASIARPAGGTTAGIQGYGGVTRANETTLAYGLKCRIEIDRQGTIPVTKLPSDAAGQSIWKVIFPRMALGFVQTSDIITDELNNRYEVIAAEWGRLVTTCRCQIQQA